ncbi:Serine/threonine-protein kinase 11-interacting protein [Cocos nucifera]|uniref:Serine/threonine-protein kinase 11-interacting protein n=1 Tax=Cocos nucifera TaxID=13894 RepID=A0A8K0MWW3_COCNU|nr:Serine/threonine-protein kinase 11-interacting protein [Cocos nucifera]
MAIVTGDRYLEYLVRYVEKNAGPLLEGTLTLKLNPVGLHYVQSRLEALQELEGLLAGAPVDYLRAYVSDLGDHRALEQLRRILRLLTSLKVISVLPTPARDPTPVSLLPFGRLRVLELRGCDLSTSTAEGLLDLRHTLEKLICHNSTDALRHVFASRIVDIKDSPAWNRLSFVSCACNGLVLMDDSLQLLPVVETLDLSRNRFAKVDNLRKCSKLRHLDLGFNHLRTIALFSEVSCRIVKLVLRNNALATLRGIENLKSLEGLDLSCNIVSSFTELEILASLSCLQSLWLEGNPICCARWYRAHVFSFFSNPEKLKLDEKVISTREYWERHVIFAKRQKQPAGYGFYFPAKDNPEDENIINTKKKKHSRLACIEDEEHSRYLCSEAVDQESQSCGSDNLRKEENAISERETKTVSLFNRAECMEEQSFLWLREFEEWMDQTSEDKVYESQCEVIEAGLGKEKYKKQRKCQKPFQVSSNYFADLGQTPEGGSSSNILESDISFTDTYIDHHIGELFDSNDRAVLKPSVMNNGHVSIAELKIGGVNNEKDQLRVHSRNPQYLSPLEVKDYSHYSSSTSGGGEDIEPKMRQGSLTSIDEIIGSQPSSIYSKSPPHYQEDMLHHRLYCEEEFLQLSAESHSVGSLDSDTSCCDDASSESNSPKSELDYSLIQASINQVIDDQSNALLYEDNHFEMRQEKPCLGENSISSSDYCAQNDCSLGNHILPNHIKTCSLNDISADGGCDINQLVSQDAADMGKQEVKNMLKRMFISLSENFDTEPEFQKSNGNLEAGNNVKDAHGLPSCDVNFNPNVCKEDAFIVPQVYDKMSPLAGADPIDQNQLC